jgi:hypothetical protein
MLRIFSGGSRRGPARRRGGLMRGARRPADGRQIASVGQAGRTLRLDHRSYLSVHFRRRLPRAPRMTISVSGPHSDRSIWRWTALSTSQLRRPIESRRLLLHVHCRHLRSTKNQCLVATLNMQIQIHFNQCFLSCKWIIWI